MGKSSFLKNQEARLFKISKQLSVPNPSSKATSILSSLYCVSVLLHPLSYRAITSKRMSYRLQSWQLQGLFGTLLRRSDLPELYANDSHTMHWARITEQDVKPWPTHIFQSTF